MTLDLQILANNREALLLAEAAGWLHDYRKCSDEHLKVQAANLSGQQALPRNQLASLFPGLPSITNLLSLTRSFTDLLNDHTWNNNVLGQFLSRCHNTAHFDKQEPVGGAQDYPGTLMSTPFGFEKPVGTNLTKKLWELPWNALNQISNSREPVRQSIEALFSQTVADTRRPINEVDLWSWGLLVSALYKAALAGALLTGQTPAPSDLRWRLLGIRVNGLDYLLNTMRIPDLLARQELLQDGLNRVRKLLEDTYPLGSEVYRDENGSIYVVPDVTGLLDITDSNEKLQTLILKAFAQGTVKGKHELQIGEEMVPNLELEKSPWWGQDPGWPHSSNDKLPDISSFLTKSIFSSANPVRVGERWTTGYSSDVCTVCGLRPQGPSAKATDRNVCDICEERRAERSQEWATAQSDKTIWADEIADKNGRLALIVGHFDLIHWLDGSFLNSLLLIAPNDPENTQGKPVTPKTPSFSRLRRIWETTRTFWQEVEENTLQQLKDERRRLVISLDKQPNLDPFHVYDLVLETTDLSVVWIPPHNTNPGHLISADNFCYIAKQLKAEPAIYQNAATAAIFVEDHLRDKFVTSNLQPVLWNPDNSLNRSSSNLLAGFRISDIQYQQTSYSTAIPILAEPRVFMALVPADRALKIVQAIKCKYEREMGKVRNRLPLYLGIVFAPRRTPLRALLDAGRSMTQYPFTTGIWKVESHERRDCLPDGWPRRVSLTLRNCHGRSLRVEVPTVMGDNETKDLWYPYWRLENGHLHSRERQFTGADGVTWVHVCDLVPGDQVHFMPSIFDFEFLDTTARRFEIHYNEHGQRPYRTRYLEDLDRLETLWGYMQHLSTTQRHQVIRTIEATREAWYGQDQDGKSLTDGVFRQFVADTLAGAEWPRHASWHQFSEEWRKYLVQAGVRGELADLLELHMEILKED